MHITFHPATPTYLKIILEWLAEPHMQEYWDNSEEHKEDIRNFIHGKKQTYFYGTTKYWIGFVDGVPYSFILSDQFEFEQPDLTELHKKYMSKDCHNIGLDFGIGNKDYLGKGLAAQTLSKFVEFYHQEVDPKANIFLIDPDLSNPKAKHLYEKAGFTLVGEYDMQIGTFEGQRTSLLIKRL